MEDNILEGARQALTSYLEENNCRKTPERYAILEMIYAMDGYFTLEELGQKMEQSNFRVSRATLYNAVRLFMRLRLVVRHNFQHQTTYEACFRNEDHCHQICTLCGKVKDVSGPEFSEAARKVRLKRFHPFGYALYVYGICSTCQAKITRMRGKKKNSKQNNNSKK